MDDLLMHYKTDHRENELEALGYSSSIFETLKKSNLAMDSKFDSITKTVVDFKFDKTLLKKQE